MEKKCRTCDQHKDIQKFKRDKRRKDGRTNQCKECCNKERRENYRNNPEVRRKKKEYVARYRSDPDNLRAYKEYNAQYMRTKKGREVQRISQEKYEQEHPERIKAKSAVNNAIQWAGFPSISTQKCIRCGAQAEHYHHHSYDPEHWLDVEPLCIMCHRAVHKEMDQSS